jgi:hypothetical protein
MTYRHKNFDQSEVMREFEKLAQEINFIKISEDYNREEQELALRLQYDPSYKQLSEDKRLQVARYILQKRKEGMKPLDSNPLGADKDYYEERYGLGGEGSLAEAKKKQDDAKLKKQEEYLEKEVGVIMDIAGFIPVYGDILDALRGACALTVAKDRDDVIEGCLLLVSALPILGDIVGKGGRAAFKTYKLGYKEAKAAGKVADFALKNKKDISFLKKTFEFIRSNLSSPETKKRLSKFIIVILNSAKVPGSLIAGYLKGVPQTPEQVTDPAIKAINKVISDLENLESTPLPEKSLK